MPPSSSWLRRDASSLPPPCPRLWSSSCSQSLCCVKREPAAPSIRSSDAVDFLVEIDGYNYGFPLISGPEEVVRQFCRHWGHPVRKDYRGRVREVASIALVYSFVSCSQLVYSVCSGLSQTVQIIWLAYLMYIIVVMHLSRLVGFEGLRRLEDNLAYELATHGSIRLHSHKAGTIWARLRSVPVSSIREGREVHKGSPHSKQTAVLSARLRRRPAHKILEQY